MNKTKTSKLTNIDINTYSLYQLCRWTALEEAVNIIGDKCEDRKLDFESIQLNPLDIFDYVEKATDNIYSKYFGKR
jgi:hypothetical protein